MVPPLALAKERAAAMRLFIELSMVIRDSIFEKGTVKDDADGTLLLVAACVVLGHAERRPMNATKVAHYLNIPRTTVIRKLERLVAAGIIVREGTGYFQEPSRAVHPSPKLIRRYAKVLTTACVALEPFLEEMRVSSP